MFRPAPFRAGAVVFALGGMWLASTQQSSDPPLRIEEVRPDLHVIYGAGGNVGVLTTPEGVVLVDDKFERHVEAILALVAEVSDQPVRYVFNTHHHGDHSGGNAKLAATAEIVAHENAQARLERSAAAGAPRLAFTEQMKLKLGGREARAIYFGPGHTNGDAIIYFPGHRVIHTGDLFVRGAPFIDYDNGGSAEQWDDTLNAVLQLEFDVVIPGHGPVANREDLARWKADFETFRDRVSELSRAGKSPEEASREIQVDDLEGWAWGPLQARAMSGLLRELR